MAEWIQQIPEELPVRVDSRERKPLPFPSTIQWFPPGYGEPIRLRIVTETETMAVGDYLLAPWPDISRIERKGAATEVAKNFLSRDRKRQFTCFKKLQASCRFPYLLMEFTPADVWSLARNPHAPRQLKLDVEDGVDPQARLLDHLCTASSLYGLRFLWVGGSKTTANRRRTGELIVRVMLNHVWDVCYRQKGFKNENAA